MNAGSDAPTAGTWSCPACMRSYPDEFTVCPLDATPRGGPKAGDPLIGVVLGSTYRITQVLGQGGMARIYVADHLRIEQRFAVKIIHGDLAHEPSMLARFEREARAAGKIHSQHVVRMVDVLRLPDERPAMITELLEGQDLQAKLDFTGKLSVAEAIPIARQLCRGVAAAHALGIVHRDLKPSNVFLCESDTDTPLVKIFDFGIAKLDDDEKLTNTGAVIGTAAYMAPEQARRAADVGPKADIYSIGAILYHMLTGEPPYGNLPAVSRFALLLSQEPARPRSREASIPEGVEAVIQNAMARELPSRIASADELDAQLAVFDAPAAALAAIPVRPRTDPRGNPVVDPTAQTIALKARLARPGAVLAAVCSALAVGAWLAAVLATLMAPTTHGERVLIGVIAIAALAGVATLHVRALRPAWASSPAVSRYIAPYARSVLAGVTAFGACELFDYGWLAVANSEPLRFGFRVAFAGVAAAIGLGWRRFGLDEKLRDRIG